MSLMNAVVKWAVALLLLAVAACAAPVAAPEAARPSAETVAEARTARPYELGPGDQVRITVFGEEELTGEYQVGAQGAVSFPLAGDVMAAGLSASVFAENLAAALSNYIRAPRVAVEVLIYRPFYILGEVEKAGTYPYQADLTVIGAVATAGGFTYRADRRRVHIKRAGEAMERSYPLTSAILVEPGDTIRIGERLF